jgi:uncharacterized protein (TIGR02284 family)
MDVKALFTGHSRRAILSNCHFGEDAAQKAYQSALDSENLPSYIRDTITNQKQLFKASHDEIKAFAEQEV